MLGVCGEGRPTQNDRTGPVSRYDNERVRNRDRGDLKFDHSQAGIREHLNGVGPGEEFTRGAGVAGGGCPACRQGTFLFMEQVDEARNEQIDSQYAQSQALVNAEFRPSPTHSFCFDPLHQVWTLKRHQHVILYRIISIVKKDSGPCKIKGPIASTTPRNGPGRSRCGSRDRSPDRVEPW